MNDWRGHCLHGAAIDRTETDEDGWVTPYADACTLCKGEPAGLKYKPGEPLGDPT